MINCKLHINATEEILAADTPFNYLEGVLAIK